jgi:hypothetical protein
MWSNDLLNDLSIREDVRSEIRLGPRRRRIEVARVLGIRGIVSCSPYSDFLATFGSIEYGNESRIFDLEEAANAKTQKSIHTENGILHGRTCWMRIAWNSRGYDYFIMEFDERFGQGVVFMTTPDIPLETALIVASSPAALARLMAKDYEWFVRYTEWSHSEDATDESDPISIWPFPRKTTGKELAFEVDPGLRELDSKFPQWSCFYELNGF